MSNSLEIDSVIKSYEGEQILTDIYLKCQTGDIIGILGRNGTGKSTLLKILFGTLPADRKSIQINGRFVNEPYKCTNEIGYLPQHPFLPRHLRVSRIIELYIKKNNSETFVTDSVLTNLMQNKISQLSGGELRYLEIKLLLYLPCKFVLLDEPFNGVAPVVVTEIKKLIKEASKTKGIILTDHDYKNVLEVANQFRVIYDGGIKEIKDKQELVRWGYIRKSKLD